MKDSAAPLRHRLALAAGRRGVDVVVAAVMLLLILPVGLAVALAILVESGRPVLSRGWRVGRDGRFFRIYKFRSTIAAAGRAGGPITKPGDRRVTRVGRVLRRGRLDELPQILNVLRGHMSLVGPRPEHPNYVRLYSAEQRRVLSVRPGITGAASVRYRDEAELPGGEDPETLYRQVVMPEKLRLELEYLDHRGFWSDLGLIVATLAARPSRGPAVTKVPVSSRAADGRVARRPR